MPDVQPSTVFETVAEFQPGLVGTLGVQITDGQDSVVTPRTTAGIIEFPPDSGLYPTVLTSPGTAGQYLIVFDDGEGNYAVEELLVTQAAPTPTVIGSGNLYVTRDQLKEILGATGTDFADDAIDIAIAAASRSIDGYRGTRFYPTQGVRYYRAQPYDPWINLGDTVSVDEVAIDADGDNVWETVWIENLDYWLDPPNAVMDGVPIKRLSLMPAYDFLPNWPESLPTITTRTRFPIFPRAIRVTGTFGWATAPPQVTQACVLLANRFLTRARQAPLGVLIHIANEAIGIARLGRIDPDAAWMLDQIPGGTRALFV